jgi:TLC domain
MESIQSHFAEIELVAKAPVHQFVTREHAVERVLPAAMATMALATAIYILSFPLAVNKVLPGDDKAALQARRRLSCIITNASINLCLGILGIYYEYFLLPKSLPMVERIPGFDDFFIFAAIQIGYQTWSLLMATFFVEEKPEMIVHHISVITVASMPGFFSNGFRYYSPYFLGIYELSSVPLGVMNAFKDNKHWVKQYPGFYGNCRIVFAASFLTIRIVMLVPRLTYLRDAFLLPYFMGVEHYLARAYLFAAWVGSTILFFLQLYWGYLIIIGIIKTLQPKKSSDNKKDQ